MEFFHCFHSLKQFISFIVFFFSLKLNNLQYRRSRNHVNNRMIFVSYLKASCVTTTVERWDLVCVVRYFFWIYSMYNMSFSNVYTVECTCITQICTLFIYVFYPSKPKEIKLKVSESKIGRLRIKA